MNPNIPPRRSRPVCGCWMISCRPRQQLLLLRHSWVVRKRTIIALLLLSIVSLLSFTILLYWNIYYYTIHTNSKYQLKNYKFVYRPIDYQKQPQYDEDVLFHHHNNHNNNNVIQVLCIDDKPYGQTFNQILTIAAARTWADAESRRLSNHSSTNSSTDNTFSTTITVQVGLGPSLSDFYSMVLEPNDDVLLYYYSNASSQSTLYPDANGQNHNNNNNNNRTDSTTPNHHLLHPMNHHRPCHSIHRAETLFNHFFQQDWYTDTRISFLQSLIPNELIRYHAQTYLQQQQQQQVSSFDRSSVSSHWTNDRPMIVTVHRRNFEGTCLDLIQHRNNVACLDRRTGNRKPSIEFLSDSDLLHLCHLNYNTIRTDLNLTTTTTMTGIRGSNSNHHRAMLVLLCSDRQVPKYDITFPHLVSISPDFPNDDLNKDHLNKVYRKPIMILIEAWIMTLSDIHYGIPMSTVDVVVHVWRNRPWIVPPPPLQSRPDHDTPPLQQQQREMRPLSCYGSNSPS